MPFTISHAAAAYPFRRTKLVLSAVIVGCMAPDFEYFLHAGMYGRESHNLRGAFTFALPISLIVLVVFHSLLKRPLSALLPRGVQERMVFHEFRFWPLSRLLLIAASILVGVGTHLLWDSFTHDHQWAVEHIAWLRNEVTMFHRVIGYHKFFQLASTLFGLWVLYWWVKKWYRTQPRQSAPVFPMSASGKIGAIAMMTVIAGVLAFWRAQILAAPRPILSGRFLTNSIVAFISVFCVELLLFGIGVRVLMKDASEELES